ncbi:hypothetical protein [Phormidium sp. CCY1219]|nr:hypothetical protein [Phormidium sp. CCY1219]MEB3831538.1 hypothetical protein [Phormidium sp. CCY1219]
MTQGNISVRQRQDNPQQWANVPQNLGSAYLTRIAGDRPINLERSLH